jgi:hypothetical protein
MIKLENKWMLQRLFVIFLEVNPSPEDRVDVSPVHVNQGLRSSQIKQANKVELSDCVDETL